MDLFHFDCSNDADQVLSMIPHCVSPEMNEELTRLVREKEIFYALDHMDLRKASSIDGLSGMFFKEN